MIEKIFMYISSDGTMKDVRKLDIQYIINAMAKARRNIMETVDLNVYFANLENLTNLEAEYKRRELSHFDEMNKRGN
jgi:hypothetical protein